MTINMNKIASIILGGGKGTRLFPLTKTRCKPAISFGGRYRIIDVPISNSLNSDINKIYVLTQFLSGNLHRHILDTYRFSYPSQGFIELLSAEQKLEKNSWFKGPADSVRQNLDYFKETSVDYFLILSGDQLYNINFQDMVKFAMQKDADLTIASLPVNSATATRMGILRIDKEYAITEFKEKPKSKNLLDKLCTKELPLQQPIPKDRPYLGSMGIYLFKRNVLFKLLEEDKRADFGKHLIPTQIKKGKTFAFLHQGYWEDIGTIESYYHANLALTAIDPGLNFYDEWNSIYTRYYNLPGPKITKTKITNSIICEGSVIDAKEVTNSILGTRTIIKKGSVIRNSYVIGNDYYKHPTGTHHHRSKVGSITIGEHCLMEKTILDRNVCIGNNVQLVNKNKLEKYDDGKVSIRDGIIIVTHDSYLPDGYVL